MFWLKENIMDKRYIFIDVDDTVRETLQSMIDFASGLGDSLISTHPVLFKSGTAFETYYYKYPQIAANAQMAPGALHYIAKFRKELDLRPLFISAQKQSMLQDVTTIWLKEKGFITEDHDVHYTYNMNDKDIFIGKLKLNYKPMLLDNFNFQFIRFSRHMRMGINQYNEGYKWDDILFNLVKDYYGLF